ncbi:MAG TPA: ABC transporter ATP-binding protein [Flavipsychrobacter sp.]|nr:ABC transporter ATP-binding protein [Flavipsychrobacter sp.]
MKIKETAAFTAIVKLYGMFTAAQKRKFQWLLVLTFISSVTDILGLATIIPVVGVVLTDSFYQKLLLRFPLLAGLSKNSLLLWITALFLVAIVLKNLFGLFVNYLQVKFVTNFYVTSSMNVLEKIYNCPLQEIQDTPSNNWVNKLSTMQMQLTSNVAISTMIILNEAMVFLLTALIVCFWNWHLFLVLIVVLIPSMGIFYARVKNLIKVAGTEKNKSFVKLYSDAQEMILGYTDIKIAGTENFLKKRFKELATRYSGLQGRTDFVMFVPTRIIEVVIFICIITILLYGVFVLKELDQIVTTISLFSVIAYRSIPSVNRFVVALNTITVSDYILNDPFFIASKMDAVPENTAPLPFEKSIRFNNVSYRYTPDSKEVVKKCDLEINRGEKIGIVGRSGSGKSTIINNVLGFLTPTSGNITIDNSILSPNILKNWWRIVGYVRQDVFIMNASLEENIAIGIEAKDIDGDKLERAIRLASLADLVNELPQGSRTVLSERGNNLSGGQKQRISIARAIYKGAQVLVFDEATSALDTKTEVEITNAIHELGKEDLTIIIIAHRYSSLRYCDKIYKLENGEISHTYNYEELLKSEQ